MPAMNSQPTTDEEEETVSYYSEEETDVDDCNTIKQLPYHARELWRANQRCALLERENAALRREVEELRLETKRKAGGDAEASHGLVATLKRVCFGGKTTL